MGSPIKRSVIRRMADDDRIPIAAYDTRPVGMEFRFVKQKPDDWSPFNGRFPRQDWMQWP